MSYDRPTLSEIYARIKAEIESRVTDNEPIAKVSVYGVLAAIVSGGLHLVYGFIDWVAKQNFPDTADETGLTRLGNLWGIPRGNPVETTGDVSFTGVATTVVPSGTVVVNSEGYEYTTQAAFTIGTTTSVEVLAAEEGIAYNTDDSLLELGSPITDVDNEVNVIDGFQNGEDLETIEDWAARLLRRIQEPPSSGNVEDYVTWALEVDGVGKAWCFPAEDYLGAGTVGLYVADENLDPVSAAILQDVEDYIEVERPIPAKVDYLNIVVTSSYVDFAISLDPNDADLQSAINTNLQNLFLLESGPGETILLSRIRSAIASAGPTDYEITDIDVGGVSIGVNNITSTAPNTPVFNSVVYSAL